MTQPARLRAFIAATILLAPAPLSAQLAVGGGFWYGPYPSPVVIGPPYFAGALWLYPPLAGGLSSCYWFGRCTALELHLFLNRLERLKRLAPTAPPPTGSPPAVQFGRVFPPDVTRTPDENIQPEYRARSLPREDYAESGKLRATK
jgi:hypothetical protein